MKSIFGILFLSILITFNPLISEAAVITSIPNLDINGTSYDVTIHTSGTYEDIWGSNPSPSTGLGSGGLLDSGPEFWGNGTGMSYAVNAIRDALGTVDTWNGTSDSVMVPYQFYPAGPPDYIPNVFIQIGVDWNNDTAADYNITGRIYPDASVPQNLTGTFAYASFEASVPIPSAIWLLGSAFIGLLGFRRNFKKA